MLTDSEIKSIIINKAVELGFAKVTFAKSEKLTTEIEHYKKWLSNGYNATMQWMEKNIDKREDPSLIVENAKTIISLAFPYNTPFNHSENNELGKIASYAWGTDYHEFIPKKLKELCKTISELSPNLNKKPIHTRPYIDTGPVLERQWAVKSGLGWQGKHSLVIDRKLGSYFFIAVIITDLELEADQPMRDYCGKCTKCISACPTGAIVADKVVDANKCISYWTIESREEHFPKEIEENINGWIFGCDECQKACPWNNHRVPFTDDQLLLPRENQTELNPENILNLDIEEFRLRFRKSPIKRTKIDGIKRNAKIVMKFYNS